MEQTIIVLRAAPDQTELDRAVLDVRMLDNVRGDLCLGSTALRHLIESMQPRETHRRHIQE